MSAFPYHKQTGPIVGIAIALSLFGALAFASSSAISAPKSSAASTAKSESADKVNQTAIRREFDQAVKLHSMRRYTDAIAHFNNAIALSAKKHAIFYCARAGGRIDADDLKGALADCNEAIRIDPNLAGAYSRRGFIYGALGQYERAVADLTKAMSLHQIDCFRWNDYLDLDNRAKAYASLGKRIDAQKDESKTKTLNLIKNAYMLRESLDSKKAIDVMNKVVAKHPDSISARLVRGICLSNYNQNDLAIQDFSVILQKNPACIPAYYFRADAYSKANEIDNSIKDYTKIIDANPILVTATDVAETGRYQGREGAYDDCAIWLNDIYALRAIQYRHQKKSDLAIKDLNKAISLAPDDYDAMITLASTYIDINKQEEAIKVCTQLIDKKLSLRSAYQVRAQALEKVGKSDKAIEDLSKLIALDSSDVDGYLWRADVYSRQKDYRKAIADYSVVLKSGKDDAIFVLRAELYMKIGETQKAIDDYSSAISMEPHASMYEGRAKAYEKLGRLDLAKKDRERIKVPSKGGQ